MRCSIPVLQTIQTTKALFVKLKESKPPDKVKLDSISSISGLVFAGSLLIQNLRNLLSFPKKEKRGKEEKNVYHISLIYILPVTTHRAPNIIKL